jgi:hypothetical protein
MQWKKEHIWLILALSSWALTACQEKTGMGPEIQASCYGENYFPLDTGRWYVYKVKEIVIDKKVDRYDTLAYQLKVLMHSEYTDSEGETAMRIERYWRTADSLAWEIKDVWSARLAGNEASMYEENIRYVKIRLPVERYKTWDGNIYNTGEEAQYMITALDAPLTIDSLQFDSTMTVLHIDDESLIHKEYAYEQYARGLGMVYKEDINLESQPDGGGIIDPDIPVEERITRGSLYYQELISYGGN